ncbi:hypothetical protein E4T44_01224 [Aureobasidium sp. EXF-8845]|nr:hypothetical protein E4T44_01224 [Aureobasidium sp. EXF-8845]KAI4857340.1 hypothetical protein E4T45_01167 [Aureobasidium sp. EXF-8846]
MPTVLSLPAELLCQIANDVDGADLINMHLACKLFHDATIRPFGVTHITHRRHAIGIRSIKALLDIVTHPTFGPYVSSVTMIGVFPLPPHSPHVPNFLFVSECLRKAFVNSRCYMHLMKQVFTKMLEHQKPVHISVCDPRTQLGFGWDDMMAGSSNMAEDCYADALDSILVAAVRANCHVRSVELSMCHYKFGRLRDALEDLLSPTRPPLRLIINCPHKRTRELKYPYTITYDQKDQSLKVDGCDMYELARAREESSIKRTLGFLLAQTTQLILEDCHLCQGVSFLTFLALDDTEALFEDLTSIRIQNFRPCRALDGDTARHHWSGILDMLSDFTGLRYFVMEGLHRDSDWDLFHFPRTTEKYELSGEDVDEQLEDMARLVATEFMREAPQPESSITEDDVIDLEVADGINL